MEFTMKHEKTFNERRQDFFRYLKKHCTQDRFFPVTKKLITEKNKKYELKSVDEIDFTIALDFRTRCNIDFVDYHLKYRNSESQFETGFLQFSFEKIEKIFGNIVFINTLGDYEKIQKSQKSFLLVQPEEYLYELITYILDKSRTQKNWMQVAPEFLAKMLKRIFCKNITPSYSLYLSLYECANSPFSEMAFNLFFLLIELDNILEKDSTITVFPLTEKNSKKTLDFIISSYLININWEKDQLPAEAKFKPDIFFKYAKKHNIELTRYNKFVIDRLSHQLGALDFLESTSHGIETTLQNNYSYSDLISDALNEDEEKTYELYIRFFNSYTLKQKNKFISAYENLMEILKRIEITKEHEFTMSPETFKFKLDEKFYSLLLENTLSKY